MQNNIPDYFSPSFIAHGEGLNEGRLIGFREGRTAGYGEGHQDGYAQGRDEGYREGWDAAIARGNEEILKQLAFTRAHIADKEALAQRIAEQNALIEALRSRLGEIERMNESLKRGDGGLRTLLAEQTEANARLRAEHKDLDRKLQTLAEDFNQHIWKYNRNMVFLSAARATLGDLTAENDAPANRVRALFAKEYRNQVDSALEKKTISAPPEQDEVFAQTLPKTHRFILDMLRQLPMDT